MPLMTLTLRTDYNIASIILENVYNADKSSFYCNKRRNVMGSAISAAIKFDNNGCYVEVQSNYYTVSSMKEITNVNNSPL